MPRWPKLSGDGRGRLLRRRAGAFWPFLPSRISRGGLRNEEHLYLRGDKPAAGGRLRHTRSEAHGFGEAVSTLEDPHATRRWGKRDELQRANHARRERLLSGRSVREACAALGATRRSTASSTGASKSALRGPDGAARKLPRASRARPLNGPRFAERLRGRVRGFAKGRAPRLRPSSRATTRRESFPFRRPTSRELTLTPTWRRECLQLSECSLRSAESSGSSSSLLLYLCSLASSRAVDNR